MGCFGHLIKLERIKAGKFTLSGSLKLDDIKTKEDVCVKIQNPLLFMNYPKFELDAKSNEEVLHGIIPGIKLNDGINLLIYNQKLSGIVECKNKKTSMKVFENI